MIGWRPNGSPGGGHPIVEIELGLVVHKVAIVEALAGWNISSQWILKQKLIDAFGLFQLQLGLDTDGQQIVQQLVNFLMLTIRLQPQIVRINCVGGRREETG